MFLHFVQFLERVVNILDCKYRVGNPYDQAPSHPEANTLYLKFGFTSIMWPILRYFEDILFLNRKKVKSWQPCWPGSWQSRSWRRRKRRRLSSRWTIWRWAKNAELNWFRSAYFFRGRYGNTMYRQNYHIIKHFSILNK